MPYAVTCRSCSTQFSISDALLNRSKGSVVALRCKHCQAAIRVELSEPPHPAPPPAPPLRVVPTDHAASPAQTPERPRRPKPPLRDRTRPGLGVSHDLFDVSQTADEVSETRPRPVPPKRARRDAAAVDLSDAARSEPPSRPQSSAPPLGELARGQVALPRNTTEDVDFLLGFRSSPTAHVALLSPSLADLARAAPSSYPPAADVPSSEPTPKPRAAEATNTGDAAKPLASSGSGRGLRWAAGVALLGALAAALLVGRAQRAERTPPPVATTATPVSKAQGAPVLAPADVDSAPAAEQTPEPPAAPSVTAASLRSKLRDPKSAAPLPTTEALKPPRSEEPAPEAAAAPAPVVASGPFDRSAAAAALAEATRAASACRKDGDPSGVANTTITFAPSGRVTAALLSGPPFAGTPTGSCIAAALRRMRVPAFEGERITVAKTIVVR